jgi:hypothetical protein
LTAESEAKASPGPAIPATVISGQSSNARPTIAAASAGSKIRALTPGLFSSRLKARSQKRHFMLHRPATGKCKRPREPLAPQPPEKQGCNLFTSLCIAITAAFKNLYISPQPQEKQERCLFASLCITATAAFKTY